MKHVLLFSLFLPLLAPAQDCSPARYRLMMRQVDTAVLRGQYDLAINKLQSAKTCQPDSEAVVNRRVLEVFKEVNRQRELSIKNEREAKRQQNIAETNLAKANRLIHHLNFQEEEAAWAYKNGKFAVINLNGDTLTDFVYEAPEPFRGGKSISRINNAYVFVDKRGLEDSIRYDFLAKTPNGYFLARNGMQLLLDEQGRLYPLNAADSQIRTDGLFVVQQDGKQGLADALGRIIAPPVMERAEAFSEGMLGIKVAGKWGFINKDAINVIPAMYDSVGFFSEGLVSVKQGAQWGFIDSVGTMVIPACLRVRMAIFKRSGCRTNGE